VIFDFNLMKATQLAEAADACRPTEQPLEHVKVVEALIEQNPAALAFPRRAPGAAGEIRFAAKPIGVHPVYAHDFAEVAALDQSADFLVTRFNAELKHSRENEPGIFSMGRNQAFGVSFVRGDGFFDHQMQSGLERGDAEGGMLKMRRGDDNGIHQLGADEFHGVAKDFDALGFIRAEGISPLVAHRCELGARNFAIKQVTGVMLADVAHANDADADGFHPGTLVGAPACKKFFPSLYR
jgi:hypothetical protein